MAESARTEGHGNNGECSHTAFGRGDGDRLSSAPVVAQETSRANALGIYGWKTPTMESFELPESDDLIIAFHLGGSRNVRAIGDQGLSRTFSAPGLLTLLQPGRTAAFRTEGHISLVTLHVPKTAAGVFPGDTSSAIAQPLASRFAFRVSR